MNVCVTFGCLIACQHETRANKRRLNATIKLDNIRRLGLGLGLGLGLPCDLTVCAANIFAYRRAS